jgi:3,4-dihydroxy-2-butanone 4-phosphate synthase
MGLTFTERAELALQANPQMSSQTVTDPLVGSSTEFPGRVVAALAADPNVMARTGGTYIAAELALAYGVTDVDGTVPPSLRAQRGSPLYGPV